jgi:hypothetical protein
MNLQKINVKDEFFSSDNLKFNYYKNTAEPTADAFSLGISVFASNYRWQNNTKLFLYISLMTFSLETGNGTPVGFQRYDYSINLFNLSSEFNSLRTMLRKVEIIPKQQFELLGNQDEDFSLILNMRMGHSYFIKINRRNFDRTKSNEIVELQYNQISIAVFQNPFIGFQPETQTPSPFYIDDYFFRVINLQNDAYLLNFKINDSKFLSAFELNKEQIKMDNIFCVNYSLSQGANGSLLDSCFTNKSAYITTSNIIKLKHKPVVFIVVPNFNITNYTEHKMVSISDNEQLIVTSFTSFINIRVQTHQLASNFINLNITGPFRNSQVIKLWLKSGTGIAFKAKYVVFLIIISVISVLIAMLMSYLISRNTDVLLLENKKFLMRSSLKPFSSAMVNLFKSSTKKKTEEEDKSKEKEENLLHSQSSDESDEPEKKTHKHLRHPREAEEEHEPKHRENDGIPRGQK